MRKNVNEFCRRGLMWGAWGGPAILAIIWLCLQKFGIITSLTVNEASVGILTTSVMGFIAAGISVVYTVEKLPKLFAGLIQCSVLYIDYLGFYLLNGWISASKIPFFTLIFVVGFVVIWMSIYITTKIKVDKINKTLGK